MIFEGLEGGIMQRDRERKSLIEVTARMKALE
jgi:hypothetical protein